MRAACRSFLLPAAAAAALSYVPAEQVMSQPPVGARVDDGDRITADDLAAVYADPGNDELFARLLARLATFEVRQGGALRRYYVWEGDLPLTREALRALIYTRSLSETPINVSPELTVMTVNGVEQIWPRPQRRITYAIDRASFSAAPGLYELTKTSIAQAARDWEAACPAGCGLRFEHISALDAAPVEGQVTFIVQHVPKPSPYLALAFFPNDSVPKRYLYVFPRFGTTSYDKVGVFRHELGHVLGYRHEQVRGVSGCDQEDGDWKPLGQYDGRSAMHYFCGGQGTKIFALTDTDKTRHAELYRKP